MKKLSISSFKANIIPKLSELDIRGGIYCNEVDDVVDWLWDHNIEQLSAICENPVIQCQNGDGSFGTENISGDCPYM